jgi:outer membrane protein, multidrug efflux system
VQKRYKPRHETRRAHRLLPACAEEPRPGSSAARPSSAAPTSTAASGAPGANGAGAAPAANATANQGASGTQRIEIRTLREGLDLLNSRAVDLRIAAADVQRAEAQARTALAASLTQIRGTASASMVLVDIQESRSIPRGDGTVTVIDPSSSPGTTFYDVGINVQQPIIHARAWYSHGTAKRNVEASELSYSDAKRTTLLSLVGALVATFTAERVAEINHLGARAAEERRDLAKKRNELGASNALDVLRAEQDLQAALAQRVTSDESLRQSRESLGLALGYPHAVYVSPKLSLNDVQTEIVRVCKAGGNIEDRSDILASKKRIEAASRIATDAKLQFAPILSLQSSFRSTPKNIGGTAFTNWSISAVLELPLWDGGARYGSMRDGAAQVEIAENRNEGLIRRATVEATQSERAVIVAEEALAVAQKAMNIASETDRLTRLAFAEGRGTSLELVVTANSFRQSEVTLALREFELVRARLSAILVRAKCEF